MSRLPVLSIAMVSVERRQQGFFLIVTCKWRRSSQGGGKQGAAMAKKRRVDELLVERALAEDVEEARRLVMAGKVRTGPDTLVARASDLLPEDSPLQVELPCPYVSRGAFKILAALERLAPDLSGRVAIDLGASTGGFTDLLLQKGARRVFAVDVGSGLLHWKLRGDARVTVLEGVNARRLDAAQVDEPCQVLTCDVAFISATAVLPAAAPFLAPGALAFVLVKPQFEVSRDKVGDGVIRDPAIREEAILGVLGFCHEQLGWELVERSPSPLKGPKGNVEEVAVFRIAGNPPAASTSPSSSLASLR
ncbi:MAG: hypothetical protein RL095_602 [Verrucomicrobiota bacterium]|jgi:23S rRNA (cytidine1920-2'-O)/16S rRNA (cytidine1409-2'-O)-methyltransferase